MGAMPHLRRKIHIKVRSDTVLENSPLYCPKCKRETIINVKESVASVIKEHGEQPEIIQ